MNPTRIAVVVCDDNRFQTILVHAWLTAAGMLCVTQCHRRIDAVEACLDGSPDVLVMDCEIPGDPIDLVALRAALPEQRILLWTGYERSDLPAETILAVDGVITKQPESTSLIAAIRYLVEKVPPGVREW